MANGVDTDRTAPGAVRSASARFAYTILPAILVYEILGHLPYLLEKPGTSSEYPQHVFVWRNKKQ